MQRHQQCIQDTQFLAQASTPVRPQVQTRLLARCFSGAVKTSLRGTVGVPGLVGLQANEAGQDLQLLGLLFAERGPIPGIVVAQSPALGTSVPASSLVTLTIRPP
jgi:hypothetical protein